MLISADGCLRPLLPAFCPSPTALWLPTLCHCRDICLWAPEGPGLMFLRIYSNLGEVCYNILSLETTLLAPYLCHTPIIAVHMDTVYKLLPHLTWSPGSKVLKCSPSSFPYSSRVAGAFMISSNIHPSRRTDGHCIIFTIEVHLYHPGPRLRLDEWLHWRKGIQDGQDGLNPFLLGVLVCFM